MFVSVFEWYRWACLCGWDMGVSVLSGMWVYSVLVHLGCVHGCVESGCVHVDCWIYRSPLCFTL